MSFLGPLIGAGASLIGGLLNRDTAQDNRRAQEAANAQAAAERERDRALQREFAQSGIQWRVADAQKAGIHPLYALGGSGASYSAPSIQIGAALDNSNFGGAIQSMGQDLSRAVQATQSQGTRVSAVSAAAAQLSLERGQLENELLKTQIASARAKLSPPQIGPPIPAASDAYQIPGQSSTPLIKQKPLEVSPAASNQPSSEGGAITDVGYARTTTGWAPVPSANVKERIEDNLPQELMHFFRNNILPSVGYNMAPPPFPAGPGEAWWWNTGTQEYQLYKGGSRPFAGHKWKGR